MPNLACRICGRVVFTTAPIDALFAEERRCPRCGAMLAVERRGKSQRQGETRKNPTGNPGPPDGSERRVAERRWKKRRRDEGKVG